MSSRLQAAHTSSHKCVSRDYQTENPHKNPHAASDLHLCHFSPSWHSDFCQCSSLGYMSPQRTVCAHLTSCWCRFVRDRRPFTAVMGTGEWWSWCVSLPFPPFPSSCVFQGTDSLGKQMHNGRRHRVTRWMCGMCVGISGLNLFLSQWQT